MKFFASSVWLAQAVKSCSAMRVDDSENSAISACWSSARHSACNTAWPASSATMRAHCPATCNASRKACSQSHRGREACSAWRTALAAVTKPSVLGACGVFRAFNPSSAALTSDESQRHSRNPALRHSVSSVSIVCAEKAGAFLSQSKTASVEASQAHARSRPIKLAAARVVDSVQPVSSRTASPLPANIARTRRVNTRSTATSATGHRPAARCASTQAAAICASSSASWLSCRASESGLAMKRGPASGLIIPFSGKLTPRLPRRNCKARASGSA